MIPEVFISTNGIKFLSYTMEKSHSLMEQVQFCVPSVPGHILTAMHDCFVLLSLKRRTNQGLPGPGLTHGAAAAPSPAVPRTRTWPPLSTGGLSAWQASPQPLKHPARCSYSFAWDVFVSLQPSCALYFSLTNFTITSLNLSEFKRSKTQRMLVQTYAK